MGIKLCCPCMKRKVKARKANDAKHATTYQETSHECQTLPKNDNEEDDYETGNHFDESTGNMVVMHNHDNRDNVMERIKELPMNFDNDSALAQENTTRFNKSENGSTTSFPNSCDLVANNDDMAIKLIKDESNSNNNPEFIIDNNQDKIHACDGENCLSDVQNANNCHIQESEKDLTYNKNEFNETPSKKILCWREKENMSENLFETSFKYLHIESLGVKVDLYDEVNWNRRQVQVFMANELFAGRSLVPGADEGNLRVLYLSYLGRHSRAVFLRDSSFRRASFLCVSSILGSDLLQRLADLGFYIPAISEDVHFVMRATVIQRVSRVITSSSTDISYTITWHIVPVDQVDAPALEDYLHVHLERGYAIPTGNEQLGGSDLQAAMSSSMPFQFNQFSLADSGREGYESRFSAEEYPVIFLGRHVDSSHGIQAHAESYFIMEGLLDPRFAPIQVPIQVVSDPYPHLSECTIVPSGVPILPYRNNNNHRNMLGMPMPSGFIRYVEFPNPRSQDMPLNEPTAQAPRRNPNKDNDDLE